MKSIVDNTEMNKVMVRLVIEWYQHTNINEHYDELMETQRRRPIMNSEIQMFLNRINAPSDASPTIASMKYYYNKMERNQWKIEYEYGKKYMMD